MRVTIFKIPVRFLLPIAAGILFLFPIATLFSIDAGGGRFTLQSYDSPGYTDSNGVHIQAWLLTSGQRGWASVGEHAEFRIQNPRAEDRCNTTTAITTEWGQIFGVCYAAQAGSMLVYVHSFDKNEDSSPIYLYFHDKPTPTQIPIPSPTPTKIPPAILPSTGTVPAAQQITIKPTPLIKTKSISPTPIKKLDITPSPMMAQQGGTQDLFVKFFSFFNNLLSKLLGQ